MIFLAMNLDMMQQNVRASKSRIINKICNRQRRFLKQTNKYSLQGDHQQPDKKINL